MSAEASPQPAPILESWLGRHEALVVAAASAVAGLRALLFAAGLPFFANTDEQAHFDVVYKYAYEGIPTRIESYSPGASRLIVLHESPEYLHAPGDPPGSGIPPPLWTLPDGPLRSFQERALLARRMRRPNYESTQPPVYYAAAAAWYRVGKALGASGGHELYWVRMLDVLALTGLVWASFG